METRYFYAIIDTETGICIGTLNTFEVKDGVSYIPIEVYDDTMVGRKMWTGSEWVDNPNYVEPEI